MAEQPNLHGIDVSDAAVDEGAKEGRSSGKLLNEHPKLESIDRKQGIFQSIFVDELMQDGTKIRAHAGADAARREKTLNEHLERAHRRVADLADPNDETISKRRQAAQERAARQQVERLEQAAKELKTLQSAKKD